MAREPLPGGGAFDVLVSMHTLYWHPDPAALLAACRRALKPGGHAVFLTYERPARVARTFAEVRRQHGWGRRSGRSAGCCRPRSSTCSAASSPATSRARSSTPRCSDAGFEILERRTTFLAGISMLAWARDGPSAPAARR